MLLDLNESPEGGVGLASLLFPDIIPFSMFLHRSSIQSSFAAFIFFLTSLFTFLYFSPASVLVSGRTDPEPRL